MKISRVLLSVNVFLIMCLSALCISCTEIDDMLVDYNHNFKIVYDDPIQTVFNPGEYGFDEKNMLLERYVVSNWGTLNLCAPNNCVRYRWIIQDVENNNDELKTINVKTIGPNYSDETQRFVVYVPTSTTYKNDGKIDGRLTGGKTYRLCLKAWDEELDNAGAEGYTDYADLVIYNEYFFSTGIVTIPPGSINPAGRISASNENVLNVSSTKVSARTILPSAIDIDNNEFKYYVSGRNSLTGQSVAPFEVNLAKDESDPSNKTGLVDLNLPRGLYSLTIYAIYDTPETLTNDYLLANSNYVGFSTADLRYTSSPVFVMSPSPNNKKGSAELKIFTNGWDFTQSVAKDNDITVKLMTLPDDENPEGTVEASTTLVTLPSAEPSEPNIDFEISAGSYNLLIEFTDGTNIWTWADNIVISQGRTTSAVIGLYPVVDEPEGPASPDPPDGGG